MQTVEGERSYVFEYRIRSVAKCGLNLANVREKIPTLEIKTNEHGAK